MAEDRLMVSVSGVRGTIGGTLTPQIACQFGSAFGTMLGAGKTVAIGRDTRPSGPMIVCGPQGGPAGQPASTSSSWAWPPRRASR